jgi:transcriptional regulator with XRE-family HTH domain
VFDPLPDLILARRLARSGTARRIRLAAGLTQAELARAIGCSHTAVSQIERGLRSPRPELALRYASVLSRMLPEIAVEDGPQTA